MSKINVLDSSVFNRIAAGEVVENPRSVVKELLENSIDAGADAITVEIRNGGVEYICVTDNGKGIDREDMPVAFLPHATSKISDLHDLDAIVTLGFRGEALPSIASVANVEMISRTAQSTFGYKITLENGIITAQGECGAAYGTKITVRDLFGNVPARAKFLRKVNAEEGSVTELVVKIILANPHLKIKYIADGDILYQSDGKGIESAVYTVYGAQFLEKMDHVSYTAPDIELYGLIGKPNFTKHNRLYQTLIVNGRYVVNSDISYCIQQCYATYLMKRQFPVYLLYLTIPTDTVDVNVHPNKLDVRFANEKRIKGVLYNTVKTKVDASATEPVSFSPVSPLYHETSNPVSVTQKEEHTTFIGTQTPIKAPATGTMAEPGIIRTRINSFVQSAEYHPITCNGHTAPSPSPIQVQSEQLFSVDTAVRYAGKLFNTYLFAESGDNFYIIDQHAAHEKLLYDKLLQQAETGETAIQDLLVPYIFDVSPSEKAALIERLPQINAYGFKIDALNGYSFSLYALPVCCADLDLKNFVSMLLEDIDGRKTEIDFVKDKLMQAACKSAVKGEEDLTPDEIDCLIRQLRESGATRFCPHGRPTVIQCKKTDLEKVFKRLI